MPRQGENSKEIVVGRVFRLPFLRVQLLNVFIRYTVQAVPFEGIKVIWVVEIYVVAGCAGLWVVNAKR